MAIFLSMLIFLALPYMIINVDEASSAMIVLLPLTIGLNAAFFAALWKKQSLTTLLKVTGIIILLCYVAAVIIAQEGAICIIIYSLVIILPYVTGVIIGWAIQNKIWTKYATILVVGIGLLTSATLPNNMSEDKIIKQEIIIQAPRHKVWQQLHEEVRFGKSDDFFFRNGVSYPISMKLRVTDIKKELHCDYNNGSTNAPLLAYENGHLFRFQINDSLISMREKSIYSNPQTMHIKNYFVVNYGEFKVDSIGINQTRLTATTNYKHHFKPEFYTDYWITRFVNTLHLHVLEAVQTECETSTSL
jgi:hypothetical protein